MNEAGILQVAVVGSGYVGPVTGACRDMAVSPGSDH